MNTKQIFLSLAASFMAAMAPSEFIRHRIARALELAIQFTWGDGLYNLEPEQAAFQYAAWIINGGKPPSWLPQDFNHGYLG